ncbi:efflux RND transporter periplasmic adaptor subunit [Mucilaginibacter rubeus]|uniref:HlyD family efflux transporter periplasmic adaptor subunit n=1 Tax=Mucilaginibacter rubeus TaxID=2027860 RepID=A0A5C1HT45_9SPHI|nr:efflux RND transporter periplasmic adaptor subunit [Mucilaginibacter rubeus]QEM09052.1 HlyD family efflux transporter periplasmic adaptor subunit [Mucilaginibacter rubeus]
MKRNWKSINTLLLLLLLLAACSQSPKPVAVQQEQQQEDYTCSMHPQIHENHPGNCPICGMELVKKTGQSEKKASVSLPMVLQPVNSSVITDVQLISPVERSIADTINADGYINFDTRTFNNIAARFSGRIEKLYVKFAFQKIQRGQRIMDIYSPEMVTAQQDLLFLIKHSSSEESMINSAKQKLLLLGMTRSQIDNVIKTGKAYYALPVYSPYEGHVHDVAHSQMPGENDQNPDFAQNAPLAVKEGMYVTTGQTLFNVVDPHRLWAILKIKPADAGRVRIGQPVNLSIPDLNMVMAQKVGFIEPVLQPGDRSTSVRVYLDNHQHGMKVGSLVRASIMAAEKKGLWIAQTAVTALGLTRVVWIKDGVVLKVRKVKTGVYENGLVQIISGLDKQDKVAANAQYLIDSDSFIKINDHD